MAKKKVNKKTVVSPEKSGSDSLVLSKKGLRTSQDFAALFATLMTDLLSSKVTPTVGSVVCNAGGKLLKVVELQQRYGKFSPEGLKVLMLSGNADEKKQDPNKTQ